MYIPSVALKNYFLDLKLITQNDIILAEKQSLTTNDGLGNTLISLGKINEKTLQKAKDKLFPFGFLHLKKKKKNSKDVTFYLIGVHPEYQNKGVHAIIFKEYHTTFTKKGIQNCIRTPELADNHAIHLLWKNFDPKIVCRRKTFRKEL